jgi:hypothetical protein
MNPTFHNRTTSHVPSTSTPQISVSRKRNLSASAIPVRQPPNLRASTPSTAPVREDEDEDDEKDDYGDLGVNNGENRDEETKEERERLKYVPLKPLTQNPP